jgi:hypothetical protein
MSEANEGGESALYDVAGAEAAQLSDEAHTTGVVIRMSAEARIPHVPLLPRRTGESTIVKMDATHRNFSCRRA